MRRIYQTDLDEAIEWSLVRKFGEGAVADVPEFKDEVVAFSGTETTCPYDFDIHTAAHARLETGAIIQIAHGDPIGIVEVKSRNIPFALYSTYKLSKRKCDSIIRISEEMGLPALLVIGWRDKIGWMYLNNQEGAGLKKMIASGEASVCSWGRLDRNDPHDVEDVYEWHTDNFSVSNYKTD